jgi:hypothetical protein
MKNVIERAVGEGRVTHKLPRHKPGLIKSGLLRGELLPTQSL